MEDQMLRIIMSDLKYFKHLSIFMNGLKLLFFMLAVVFDYIDIYEFMLISSIIFFIEFFIVCTWSNGEKHERFDALLPLSVKTRGKYRLVSIILSQTILFLLWFILYLTRYVQEDPGVIWTMISIIMFNLIFIYLLAINGDLGFYGIKYHKPILALRSILALTITVSIILYFLKFSDFNSDPSNQPLIWEILKACKGFFDLPYAALLMSLLAVIIQYISYKVYINRRSYLA